MATNWCFGLANESTGSVTGQRFLTKISAVKEPALASKLWGRRIQKAGLPAMEISGSCRLALPNEVLDAHLQAQQTAKRRAASATLRPADRRAADDQRLDLRPCSPSKATSIELNEAAPASAPESWSGASIRVQQRRP